MNCCIYTGRECVHADECGECIQGHQNCGWENWIITDYDPDEYEE